ncbi:hypothetical protein GQ600_16066 [Phytophthora cactorum]|nr:hypothetical protein GQ600_16066 [Phytophthora cactorum]
MRSVGRGLRDERAGTPVLTLTSFLPYKCRLTNIYIASRRSHRSRRSPSSSSSASRHRSPSSSRSPSPPRRRSRTSRRKDSTEGGSESD